MNNCSNVFNKNEPEEKCECCEETVVHESVVAKARREMPEEGLLYDLADLFKIFGDTTRVKILYALFESEMCVCDICELLGMTQSAISHQLRVLKQARLVRCRREGKSVIYNLSDDHVKHIMADGFDHIME